MMPGYNTGKLIIGSQYSPPKHSHMNQLDIFWQGVLLQQKQTLRQRLFLLFCGGQDGY